MTSSPLARVWSFARPYRRGHITSLLAGFGMMAAGLAIPPIIGMVFDDLADGRTSRLPWLGLAIVGVGLAESVLAFLRRHGAARASIAMEEDMRNELYAHLQRLQVSFHDGWQSGQLLSRAMGDCSTIRRFVGFSLQFLIINAVQFVVVAFLMLRLNGPLALLTAVMALPIILLTRLFNRRYHNVARAVQDETGDLTTIIEESATGIRIIKAFGRGPMASARFADQADVVHDANMRAVRLRGFFWSLLHFLPNMNLLAVLAFGGYSVTHRTLSPGGLAAFITYLLMMNWPIRSIGWILANGEEASTAAERIFEVYDSIPEIADRSGATALVDATGTIRFESVSFAYPGSAEHVLREITLDIHPGETLAIVGMTGSGKTTLAMLVPRLYDATGGAVTLDGHDVRDLSIASLRSHVGVAFEDPVLFSMSVRENLVMGRPDASEDELRAALEMANATFVYDLPWGLDTRIGEQGYSLSGGQRQRLALARAVIGKPQVLVLDDPLSAVDVHTEAQIEAALARVLKGVTALLVVHRPSTLALADRVALLHEGTIVATGTHSELMETVPMYGDILSQHAEEVAR